MDPRVQRRSGPPTLTRTRVRPACLWSPAVRVRLGLRLQAPEAYADRFRGHLDQGCPKSLGAVSGARSTDSRLTPERHERRQSVGCSGSIVKDFLAEFVAAPSAAAVTADSCAESFQSAPFLPGFQNALNGPLTHGVAL